MDGDGMLFVVHWTHTPENCRGRSKEGATMLNEFWANRDLAAKIGIKILSGYVAVELPPIFRLPRVTYNRSHHERGDDEDTEAGIHRRVQGIGGHASQRRDDSWRGGQGVGAGRANAPELGQGGRGRHAQRCWSQGDHTRADGTVTTARQECATEARQRNPKKSAYFAKEVR